MSAAASASTGRTTLLPHIRKPPNQAQQQQQHPRAGPQQPLLSTLPLERQSRLLAASATLESTASLLAHSMALMESIPQARWRQEGVLLRLGRDAADSATPAASSAAAGRTGGSGSGSGSGDPWTDGVEWPEDEDEAALEREDRRRLFHGMKWNVRAEKRRMRANALVARRKAEEAERAWRDGVRWEESPGEEEADGMDVDRKADEGEDEHEEEEDDDEDKDGDEDSEG